jgi:hypothetical protein
VPVDLIGSEVHADPRVKDDPSLAGRYGGGSVEGRTLAPGAATFDIEIPGTGVVPTATVNPANGYFITAITAAAGRIILNDDNALANRRPWPVVVRDREGHIIAKRIERAAHSPAMSAAVEVPVVAAEIEGERERDDGLGYGGTDVIAVDAFVKVQRPPDHAGRNSESEQNETDEGPAVRGHSFGAGVCRIRAIQTAPTVRPMPPRTSTEPRATLGQRTVSRDPTSTMRGSVPWRWSMRKHAPDAVSPAWSENRKPDSFRASGIARHPRRLSEP